MRLTKRVRRTLIASAVTVLAFGAAPARAGNTNFGNCVGSAIKDCTAGTGHVSVSITSALSVNEMRAISFGNFAASTPTAGDTVVLGLDGSRTVSGGFTALHGANGGATGAATGSALEVGSQSAGHYTISSGAEGGTTQVYISFADNTGKIIDMCDDSTNTVCDDYHTGNSVNLGDGMTVDKFVINQTGSDVYGHYITNAAGGQAPGISHPWLPGGTTAHTGGKSDGATAGQVDVVVGATLHSDGTALTVGKHSQTFNIMASY